MKSNRLISWGIAEIFFVLSVLVAVTFAILSSEIAAKLQLSESDLGLLSGVFFITYALGQLVLGILLSYLPARMVLGVTALVAAAGTLLFSVSAGLNAALIARGLMGLGLSTTFVGVIYLVGRGYSSNFAFMSSLSQSLANVSASALAILSAFVPFLVDFRMPFQILGVLFLVTALLIFFLVGGEASGREPAARPSLVEAFKSSVQSVQFWAAVVYYCGLFGTLLAFADLWNIQFQMTFFKHSIQQSSVMNAMIPLGVTLGGLGAGWWAKKAGFVLPARIFALFTLFLFGILIFIPLPEGFAGVMMFLVGCGFSASTLGLTAIHAHLPPQSTALATSLAVTASCIFGGVIQPLVGSALAAPHRANEFLALIHAETPDFASYQRGLLWLMGSVAAAVAASFMFRPAPTEKPTQPGSAAPSRRPAA